MLSTLKRQGRNALDKEKSMCKSPIAERSKVYLRNRKKTRRVVRQGKDYGRCVRKEDRIGQEDSV